MKIEMKKYIGILSFVAISVNGAFAQTIQNIASEEGGHSGNGGTLLRCDATVNNPYFKNKTVLADFGEVEILEGLKGKLTIPENTSDSIEVQISSALSRISDKAIRDELETEIIWIRYKAENTPDSYWPVTDDVKPFKMPDPNESCQLLNAINFISRSNIQKKNNRIESLKSATQEAGLWVHEGVYELARKYAHVKTTLSTRRINVLLFAKEQKPELLKTLVDRFLKVSPGQVVMEDVSPGYKTPTATIDSKWIGTPMRWTIPDCAARWMEFAMMTPDQNKEVYNKGWSIDPPGTTTNQAFENSWKHMNGGMRNTPGGTLETILNQKRWVGTVSLNIHTSYLDINEGSHSNYSKTCVPEVEVGNQTIPMYWEEDSRDFHLTIKTQEGLEQKHEEMDNYLDGILK